MPRPPAKRGRAARQKPAPQPPAKPRKNDSGHDDGIAPSESLLGGYSKDDASMSGALDWKDSRKTRKASSVTKATNTSSFEASGTRKNETPKTNRAAYESGSSKLPGSASRPATRGQPFASVVRRGDASSKIQKIATPGFDSSMLSNFRPRPRQPSILQLMDDDGSSDLDSEAFLGSFDPDDESTPLKLSKRKTSLPLDALPPTPSPKKTAQPLQSAKKRKLIAVEIPVLPAFDKSYPLVTSDRPPTPAQDEAGNVSSDDDSIPLPEPFEQQLSPEIASQTMAQPASSSVAGSPAKRPPEARSGAESTKHAQISTATLRANLLAARRRRRREGVDVYDMPSDNDNDARGATDEDELSCLPSRTTRNSARNPLKPKKRGVNKKLDRNARTKREAASKRRREAHDVEKPSVVIVNPTKKQLSRPSKDHITYSRRLEQDKENQTYDVQGSSSGSDRDADDATPKGKAGQRLVSAELVKQAKKFAEVDRWTMEFEDVTGEQSSPFR